MSEPNPNRMQAPKRVEVPSAPKDCPVKARAVAAILRKHAQAERAKAVKK